MTQAFACVSDCRQSLCQQSEMRILGFSFSVLMKGI